MQPTTPGKTGRRRLRHRSQHVDVSDVDGRRRRPNTKDGEFIKTFSPYHLLKEGTTYPPVFFTTSTRDDRVHPGHALKVMAKMETMNADVRYYENIEGGHGGAVNNRQEAHMRALAYTLLWQQLRK
jgi:prolyl oligopeptidase